MPNNICKIAVVIDNFTPKVKNLAKVNDCILVIRDDLAKWILAFQEQRWKSSHETG